MGFDPECAPWRKSSYSSGGEANCVEVAVAAAVGIRDTKARETGHLTVTPAAWVAFTEAIAE
ncbi:DUF397 domain-containing protein [Amycolatopsis rhabdoformis]|uniref:DUF397 domain-containing protein n=1 Tax=Amycolatopsis rhabdoformis TaxID=1448059 RepID=A0ABZ1IKX9_9PSEU|nr:DUF397 domain-containing protein [Amycolatopsis rhabdoformis]WSE35146.1 DUF397 domain-containing protein [Amycolatopsis rhabdoformis]